MVYRNFILILALLALSVVAFAQPAPTSSWLRVSVQNSDGTPFSVAPRVIIVMPGGAINQNNISKTGGLDVLFLDLTPGTYGVKIILRGTLILIPQQTVEVSRGANIFVWKLAPPITVTGEFTIDGKKAVAINYGLAYDAKKSSPTMTIYVGGNNTRIPELASNDTFKVNSDGKYTFTVIAPGTYYMKFYTDQGYCDTAIFVNPEEAKAKFDAPMLALTPGGSVELTIKDFTGKPMPKATAYFSATASTKPVATTSTKALYVPYVSAPKMILITANDNGVITTPQLPAGQLSYYAIKQPLDMNAPVNTQCVAVAGTVNIIKGIVTKTSVQMPE